MSTTTIEYPRPAAATREDAAVASTTRIGDALKNTVTVWTNEVLAVMKPSRVPAGGILLSDDRFVALDDDTLDHLTFESERRSITIQEAYEEEMAAREELARITPTNAELLRIAEKFPAPQEWYDE